jgi:acyl carrier protein
VLDRLQDRLVNVIAETLEIDRGQVVSEAAFVKDLGADSLEVVDLIVAFEEEFDLLIPDADAYQIRTVQEAMDYLASRLLKTA